VPAHPGCPGRYAVVVAVVDAFINIDTSQLSDDRSDQGTKCAKSAVEQKCLQSALKTSSEMSGDRNTAGKLFQTRQLVH